MKIETPFIKMKAPFTKTEAPFKKASYLPHSFTDIRVVFYMHQLFAFPVSIIEITDNPVHGKLKGINYAKNLSIKVSLNHGVTSMNLFNLQVWNVKMYQKIYDFCPRQSLN